LREEEGERGRGGAKEGNKKKKTVGYAISNHKYRSYGIQNRKSVGKVAGFGLDIVLYVSFSFLSSKKINELCFFSHQKNQN
jgi:hypothetical protein